MNHKGSKVKLASLRPTMAMANLAVAKPLEHTMNPNSWRVGLASATARGYGYRWQQERLRFLAAHPLCCMCEAEGRVTAATVVDHEVPHQGDQQLFWDRTNWRAMCKPHHDSDAQRKDNLVKAGQGAGDGKP